ncbi:hypothetical protein [Sphingopyxis sp. Root1497]|uniref:hypothetical protein n=1 Tax=Sphingopyxis sp. Root1497 TaxID=1736474 RepID=UPI000A466F64
MLIALVAWLPLALKRLPLSLPIICIAIGGAIFALPGVTLRPLPLDYPEIAERFTEFVVIIALMGAGLNLDRRFSWRQWRVTWRLLAITMPLSIAAIAVIGGWGSAFRGLRRCCSARASPRPIPFSRATSRSVPRVRARSMR